jgi:hypothetical protein
MLLTAAQSWRRTAAEPCNLVPHLKLLQMVESTGISTHCTQVLCEPFSPAWLLALSTGDSMAAQSSAHQLQLIETSSTLTAAAAAAAAGGGGGGAAAAALLLHVLRVLGTGAAPAK